MLATSVAATSSTMDGLVVVLDSGLVGESRFEAVDLDDTHILAASNSRHESSTKLKGIDSKTY